MKVFRTSFDVTNVVETLWRHCDVNGVVTTSWKRHDVKRRLGNFHIQPITKVVLTSGFVVTSNDVLMTYFAEWVVFPNLQYILHVLYKDRSPSLGKNKTFLQLGWSGKTPAGGVEKKNSRLRYIYIYIYIYTCRHSCVHTYMRPFPGDYLHWGQAWQNNARLLRPRVIIMFYGPFA